LPFLDAGASLLVTTLERGNQRYAMTPMAKYRRLH